jgi:hypothetical protein
LNGVGDHNRSLAPGPGIVKGYFIIFIDKVGKRPKVSGLTGRLADRGKTHGGKRALSIEIEEAVLEKACREMIETILYCLPNSYKGTIYRIGKPPKLIAERITSGVRDPQREGISWGLPEKSEYNPPGRPWVEYRDQQGRPFEAMAWCVEKQKSWTAEDPRNDLRSVRLQVEGAPEDFHHMEPVLLHKSDLSLDMYPSPEYSRDDRGQLIWQDTDYVVVAVIKIHFKPYTIGIGSHETGVIKKLSRSLGTELLSYQLRQDSMKAIQQLAKDRLNACNILADSLRNAITKSALILSLVKTEIGFLREQWEQVLLEDRNEKNEKVEAIRELNGLLAGPGEGNGLLRKELMDVQNRFLELALCPEKGENWVCMQIEERWRAFFDQCPQDDHRRNTVGRNLDRLKRSLHFGRDPAVVSRYNKMPEDLKREWVDLIYQNNDRFNASVLDRLIGILAHPALNIPSRERSRKTLIQLKALAETMNQLERNTNFLLRQVLNGGHNGRMAKILNGMPAHGERKASVESGSLP